MTVTVNDLSALPHRDGQIVLNAEREDFAVQIQFNRGAIESIPSCGCQAVANTPNWLQSDQSHRRRDLARGVARGQELLAWLSAKPIGSTASAARAVNSSKVSRQ